jgi:menaquinone-dependent protoporphyrinogen IX oxidase
MSNIVLYKSKYGNTLQYAQWIAEDLGWELRDLSDFKRREIKNYQNIIFGSGVYIGKMNKIKKVLSWFKKKPIIIFACAGNNYDQKAIADIKTKNFTEDQLDFHKFFYLAGGIDFNKVTGIQRKMLNFFFKMIEKKSNRTSDEEEILNGFYNPSNYVDKANLDDILAYARNLQTTNDFK